MKTKSLSIFLVALFVMEMNLGAEEDNNKSKEDENFKYEKIGDEFANEAIFKLKAILIGNSMVGKSALFEKICKNTFQEAYSPTVGFEFLNLIFRIVSDENKLGPVLKHQIWDCCGDEKYRSLITSFYNNASVVLLAYDVTNVKSFEDIDVWLKTAKEKSNGEIGHFVLIGTKIDLKQKRVVSKEKGETFAKEKCMEFVEVSAKTSEGLEKLKDILAKIIYEEFKKDNIYEEFKKNKKKKEKKDENDKKSDFVEYNKSTSSLCDCCKEICEIC